MIGKLLLMCFLSLDYRNKTGMTNVVNLTISKVLPLYMYFKTWMSRKQSSNYTNKSSNMKYLSRGTDRCRSNMSHSGLKMQWMAWEVKSIGNFLFVSKLIGRLCSKTECKRTCLTKSWNRRKVQSIAIVRRIKHAVQVSSKKLFLNYCFVRMAFSK